MNRSKLNVVESVACYVEESVACSVCKTLHDVDSDNFFVVWGNITVGTNGGIVGNNLDDKGKVYRATVFCKHKPCLHGILHQLDT